MKSLKKIVFATIVAVAAFAVVGCGKSKTIQKTTTTSARAPYAGSLPLANGSYDFKYADTDLRFRGLAAMEQYMIDNHIGAPLFDNGTAQIFSNRMSLPTNGNYVQIMGFGTILGNMTEFDAGTTDKKTYRTYDTGSITDINPLSSSANSASVFQGWSAGALFEFDYNEAKDGFILRPAMAQKLEALDADEKGLAKEWKITLRDDLKWEDGVAITAEDFMYTFKTALDPTMKLFRANLYFHSLDVVNAKQYFYQETPVAWESVGYKSEGTNVLKISLNQKLNEFDFMYNCSFSPVHKGLFEAGLNAEKTATTYGSSVATYKSSGPYKLTYWVAGQELRFEKNENYYDKASYNYTGINVAYYADGQSALLGFKDGKLDACTIPANEFENYKDNPKVYRAPGAVGYRLTFNRYAQDQSDDRYGKLAWEPKHLLAEDAFCEAIYFALDRNALAAILKTSSPVLGYLTNAYSDPVSGERYRNSDYATAVLADCSPSTNGFNVSRAKTLYKQALDNLKAKGLLPKSKKFVIEYAGFSSPTQALVNGAIKSQLETAFNGIEGYEKYKLTINVTEYSGYDIYDFALDAGKFDLSMMGISGGTLDPWDYFGIFLESDPYEFNYSLGFDTFAVDIEFEGEVWSFEALWYALNGPVTVANGLPVLD